MPTAPPVPHHQTQPHHSKRNDEPPCIGNYYVHETIGQGSFGKVKRGTHKDTKQQVAIKILNCKKLQSANMDKKIRREIHILSLFRHPNICRLYEVIQTQGDIFLIMEHINGGELYDYIVKKGKLSEKDARYVFQQIVCALEYCHHFRVVHRDLKPENILLGPNLQVKLIDFGLSNLMMDGSFLGTSCGSPNYAAPEVISGRLYCGPEVDVWSCGVVLYALLCGCLPFDEETVPMLFKKIKEGKYESPDHLPLGAKNLVSYLLVVDPLKRQTIPQIRDNEWFNTDLPPHLAFRDTLYSEKDQIIPEIVEKVTKMLNISESDLRAQIEAKKGNAYVSYQILADVKRQHQITQQILAPRKADINQGTNSEVINDNDNHNNNHNNNNVPTATQRELNLGLVLSVTPAMEYLLCHSNSKENKPFYNMATYSPCNILYGCSGQEGEYTERRRGSRFSLARHSKSNSVMCHSSDLQSEKSGGSGDNSNNNNNRVVVAPIKMGKPSYEFGIASSSSGVNSVHDSQLIGSVAPTNVMYTEAESKATLDAHAGWRVGLMADGSSQSIMEALYTIMEANDMEWKVVSPYHIAARQSRNDSKKPLIDGRANPRDLAVTNTGNSSSKSNSNNILKPYPEKTSLLSQKYTKTNIVVPDNLILMVHVLRLHDKHERGFIVDFNVHKGHPILGMELIKIVMEALLDRLN